MALIKGSLMSKQKIYDMSFSKIFPLYVAKIERKEALDQLDAIIMASDGVMVA